MARTDTTTHSPGAVSADARPDDTHADAESRPGEHARGRASATDTTAGSFRGTGIMWSGVLVLVGVAALTIAAIQNTHSVAIEFLWFDGTAPLVVIVLIAIGVTVLVDEAVGFTWRHRRRKRLREREELERLRGRS